jgi:hypothetical protein
MSLRASSGLERILLISRREIVEEKERARKRWF